MQKSKKTTHVQGEIAEKTQDIESKLLRKETAFEIYEILHNLEGAYKEVFWMHCFGELKFTEIAKIHGKSESWARVTYHRAKMKIKEELNETSM